MDEPRIDEPTRGYIVVAWIVALVVGAAAAAGIVLLTQDFLMGVIVGAVAVALIGSSIVLAARRTGRETIEAAPPWTGDAGIRHHSGGAI